MLEWEWLGIDMKEWPPQRLDWEMHLSTGPKCTGYLLCEDSPTGKGKSMIPSVADLLGIQYPNKGSRDFLPLVTIVYMGPGGHRQWPMSISALLDRLSWLVLQTRSLALKSFQSAVEKKPSWCPKYYKGTKIARAPPPPIKFLDIGAKMEHYEIREHMPGPDDKSNILHPRFEGDGIPRSDTFHSVIHERLEEPF